MANIKDKGMFKFAGSYEVNSATALDPRVQWDSFEDLIKKDFGLQMVIQFMCIMVLSLLLEKKFGYL